MRKHYHCNPSTVEITTYNLSQ
uniref:Uncharacterized protein n=1 Tax=Rhizophora mucronata TaxID=61149 RepID=A0A2P2QLY3_RHIMU